MRDRAGRYGIVFDAGSSGTRMHVYRWNDSIDAQPSAPEADLRTLPRITLQATEKTRPGVSSFATHPSDIGPDHLHILIDAALDIIPGDHVSSTPVFLMATAGMRLLDQDQQTSLLNEMCAFFKSSTPFQVADCQSQIRVIPGETEGLYGWIASNYLFGGFDHPDAHQHGKGHHTIGFLDMGGASTQIAFVPNATETSKHANDLKLVRLRLLNGDKVEYKVFVATWLGYGANLARDRYVDHLVAGGPGQNISMLDDPCMPHGLWTTLNGNLILDDERPESGIMTLRGTGDFQRCLQLTVSLLSKDVACKHEPCLLDGKHAPAIDFDINHFLGISEFWYTTHGVFGGAGTSYDLETYQKRVHDFCAREWKDIQGSLLSTEKQNVRKMKDSQESCFKAAWLISFLYEGIGIPRRLRVDNVPAYSFNATTGPLDKAVGTVLLDPFRPVDQIGGIDVSWALGKMVLHVSGAVPASGLFDDPVGFGSNDPTLDDFEESGPIRSGFLDQAGDSYRNFRSASMVTPAVLAFFVLLLLAAFLLRKRESRHCLYGVTNSCSGRCHGMARRPPRGFSLTSKLFGRRSGVAYERLQEEGATDRFELGPIDSDEQDKSDGSEGSAGAGRLSVSKSTLTLSAMDRSGLVSRTQSRERLSPNALLPGPGWHSRAPSPTKPKNLLLDDSKAQ